MSFASALKARAGPLAGPGVEEIPAHLLLALAVEQHDRSVLARRRRIAVGPLLVPLVELDVVGHAPLEGDVGELDLARVLARGDVLAAFAVLDHVDRRIEPADFLKRGAGDAVDLDEEIEIDVRIFAGCHRRSPFTTSVTSRAAVPDADADDDELGRIARAHADLDVQAAELLLGERIERSRRCARRTPLRPWRRTARRRASCACRKSVSVRFSFCQSARLFGSNTAQRMPSWIDSSRYRNSRRMLTYCQFVSVAVVRAPHTIGRPPSWNTCTMLMPCRFSSPCSMQAHAPLDAERAVDDLVGGRLVHAAQSCRCARRCRTRARSAAPGSAGRCVAANTRSHGAVERGIAARGVESARAASRCCRAPNSGSAGIGSRARRSGRHAARNARSAPAARPA